MNQMVSPAGLTKCFSEKISYYLPWIRKKPLSNAPDREGAFFKVPRIMESRLKDRLREAVRR